MPDTPPKRRGRPPKQPVYITETGGDVLAPLVGVLDENAKRAATRTAPTKERGDVGAPLVGVLDENAKRAATRAAPTKERGRKKGVDNGGSLESKLWAAADKQRGHMDAAEYKHVVLGLIFLKYISDAFDERWEQLRLLTETPASDYYLSDPALRETVLEDRTGRIQR